MEPLRRKRCIGSIEDIATESRARKIQLRLKDDYGYQTVILMFDRRYEVVYYRQTRTSLKALELYKKYLRDQEIWSGNIYSGLTLDEHRQLGRAFGISKNQIEWFVNDIRLG